MFSLLLASCVWAGQAISLEWGPSPEDCDYIGSNTNISSSWCVSNYRLYISTNGSGNYHTFSDLGHVTNTVYTQLVPGGHYWVVVTAMTGNGAESDPSNELYFRVPGGRPRPAARLNTKRN
jgi:hypothetical protein